MKSSHQLLILLGLAVQIAGLVAAPKRFKGMLTGLALGLDTAWILWFLTDTRSLSQAGIWSLSPAATWVAAHGLLTPAVGVEVMAKLLPRWRNWVRATGVTVIVVGYGWALGEAYGPPSITRVTLAFPDLPPGFDGYRIALVSDIHAGPFVGTRTLARWARAVEAQKPDLLVGAGDFVAHLGEEAERTGVAFETVNPPDGRLGILGNHDMYAKTDEVAQRLRRHGWVMLLDEARPIQRGADRLLFLGARFRLPDSETPAPVWQGRPWPEGFRIGICHVPMIWPQLMKDGARLTLAAHTHGGQVNFSPFFNAAAEFTPYVHGLYGEGPNRLFVTRGLGLTSFPFRLLCRPEIAVITLKRGE
jgi:hypothetical protein